MLDGRQETVAPIFTTWYEGTILMPHWLQLFMPNNIFFGCCDPLAYPLFFPNGKVGWHPKIPRAGVFMDFITKKCMDYGDKVEQGELSISLYFRV